MKQLVLLFLSGFLFSTQGNACVGGVASGSLSPNSTYQTVATQNGRYYTVNVLNCTQYEFTFCAGGASSAFDTQLTILDNSGTTELVYADDNCGTNASIVWTATFSGTIRILVSRYNCNHDLTSNVILAYRMVSGSGGNCFTLGGSAINTVIAGQNCVQLTPELNDQTGCAWNGSEVNFNTAFTLSLNAYFGNNIDGADGTAYVFQPNPNSGCGAIGGQLGAGGIPNSLIIEFDTYNNDFPAQIYDSPYDHVAVETDGNLLGPSAPYCGPVAARPGNANLDDGNMHTISISWNPTLQQLSVYVDGNLRLSCNGNFVSSVFGGDNTVYWGASASTGGLNNQQYFCSSAIALPVELLSFSSVCDGETERVIWSVEQEIRLKEYVVEVTYDTELYYPIETILPQGNASGTTYSVVIKDGSKQQAYYRLKMVDEDGNIKYSELISSKKCGSDSGLPALASYTTSGNLLNLYFTDEYAVEIYDMSGKLIHTGQTGANDIISIDKPSTGMYLIRTLGEKANKLFAAQRIYVD